MASRRFPLGIIGAAVCAAAAAGSTARVAPAAAPLGDAGVRAGGSASIPAASFDIADRPAPGGIGDWPAPRWWAAWQYERTDFDLEPAGAGTTYSF